MTYCPVRDEGLDREVEIDKLEKPLEYRGDSYPIRIHIKYRAWPHRDAAYAPITLCDAENLIEELECIIRELKDATK